MTLSKIGPLLLLFLYGIVPVIGQDQIGASYSNYTPTKSVHFNPSSILDSKVWMDIHIVGSGVYVNNNFISVPKSSLINLLNGQAVENYFVNTDKKKSHIYSHTRVDVLGMIVNQGDHGFGFSMSGHSFIDIRKIPKEFAQIIEKQFNGDNNEIPSSFNLSNLKGHAISYGELKLNYAHTFKKVNDDLFMLGVGIKKIIPLAGAVLNINQLNYDYSVLTNNLIVHSLQGDFMTYNYSKIRLNGGWGLDLGFTYEYLDRPSKSYYPNSKKSGCRRINYILKFGFAVNDIGYLKINEENLNHYGYDAESFVFDMHLSNDIDEVEHLLSRGEGNGIVKKVNKIALPTSFNAFFDYQVFKNLFYISGFWQQGLPHSFNVFGPRRASTLNITARFESKWLDVAMPISVYEFQKMQLGLQVRLYTVTIGTDKLLSLFIPSKFYGADIYAALKVPIFYNPSCKNHTKNAYHESRGRVKRKKSKGCEAYH